MIKDYSYGVALIRKEKGVNLILLVREHATTGVVEERGTWGLPKGHGNPGETPVEAARRELAEETGIMECVIDPETSWSITYPVSKNGSHFEKTVTFFLGSTDQIGLKPVPGEIAECGWFSFEDAIKKVTFESVREILQKARLAGESID